MANNPQKNEDSSVTVAALIRKAFPDYDQWNVSDLHKLPDTVLRQIRGKAGTGFNFDVLVPKSFFKEYGDQARAIFVRSAIDQAHAIHDDGSYARGVLRSIVAIAAGWEERKVAELNININPITTVTRKDGTKFTGPADEIITYAMAQEVIHPQLPKAKKPENQKTTEDKLIEQGVLARVQIPNEIMRSIVAANPQLPTKLNTITPEYYVPSSGAYDVGLTLSHGYSMRVGGRNSDPIVKSVPTAGQACPTLPVLEAHIYNHDEPPLSVQNGLMAGFVRGKVGDCEVNVQALPNSKPTLRAVG